MIFFISGGGSGAYEGDVGVEESEISATTLAVEAVVLVETKREVVVLLEEGEEMGSICGGDDCSLGGGRGETLNFSRDMKTVELSNASEGGRGSELGL